MESKILIIFFLSTLTIIISSSSSSQVSSITTIARQKTYSTFVKTSCSSSTYPSVCLKTLLPYATAVKSNPLKLVNAALFTTLRSSNATLAKIYHLSKTTKGITKWEAAVLKDCIEDIKVSMSEIKDTLKVISGLSKSKNKRFMISNAQTWISAAITNENTCLDGFSDRKMNRPVMEKKIRNSIASLARVSSNALYLINHLSV